MKLIFWIISAGMLLLALSFVLLPLFRSRKGGDVLERNDLNIQVHKEHLQELENDFREGRIDEEEFNTAKEEIENDLLIDISHTEDEKTVDEGASLKTIIPAVIMLPAFAVILYLMLGDIGMVEPRQEEVAQQQDQQGMHSVEEMVQSLRTRLEAQPEDGEGWRMLARSYVVMNRYQDAVEAYRNARKYIGDDPELLADYSEALILASNNRLTEESVNLARVALQQNPDEPKALWIAGYASFQQGKIAQTLSHWEHLLELLPPGSDEANALRENINEIRMQAGMEPAGKGEAGAGTGTTGEMAAGAAEQATAGTSIDVQVSLDSALRDRVSPDDTVFIFARASEGPRMPLAIVRKQVSDLPVKVTLDESLAMSPAMSLSNFNQVIIGARISRTGNATPSSGDLTGSSNVVQLDEVTGVKVTIDKVVP